MINPLQKRKKETKRKENIKKERKGEKKDVLLARVASEYQMHAVPKEARGGRWISWFWSYRSRERPCECSETSWVL